MLKSYHFHTNSKMRTELSPGVECDVYYILSCRQQSEQQIRMKDEQVQELEGRTDRLSRDLNIDSSKWNEKVTMNHIQHPLLFYKFI